MTNTYYKLATFDERSCCWKDGKRGYATEAEARADARKPGRYRLSAVTDGKRTDLEPFEVAGTAAAAPRKVTPAGRPSVTSLVYGKRYK